MGLPAYPRATTVLNVVLGVGLVLRKASGQHREHLHTHGKCRILPTGYKVIVGSTRLKQQNQAMLTERLFLYAEA